MNNNIDEFKNELEEFLFNDNNDKLKDVGAQSLSLKNILELDKSYVVQDFQRLYKWDKENISQLIDDFLSEETIKNNLFLGTLTLSRIDDLQKIEYEIVDGQQRLITSTLILKAIELFLKKDLSYLYFIKKSNNVENVESNIKLKNLRGEEIYKKILNLDIDILYDEEGELIQANPLKEKNKSWQNIKSLVKKNTTNALSDEEKVKPFESNFIEILKYFYIKIKEENFEMEVLKTIMDSLLKSKIIIVRIPINISSTEIFESINSKGKLLTIDELLKNYFYLNTKIFNENKKELIDQKNLINTIFNDVMNSFKVKSNGAFPHAKRYFHSFIIYNWAFKGYEEKDLSALPISEENPRKLYNNYKKFNKIIDKQTFNSFLNEIKDYIYKIGNIRDFSKKEENNLSEFKLKISLSSLTDSPLIMPLLYFLEKEINLGNLPNEYNDDFKKCISLLYKYFIFLILNCSGKRELKLSYNIISYLRKEYIDKKLLKDETNKKFEIFKELMEKLISKEATNIMPKSWVDINVVDKKIYDWKKIEVYVEDINSKDQKSFFKPLMFLINNYLYYEKSNIVGENCNTLKVNDLFSTEKEPSYTWDHIIPKSFGNEGSNKYIENNSWEIFKGLFMNTWSNIMLIKGKDDKADKVPELKIPYSYIENMPNSTAISIYFSKMISEKNKKIINDNEYKYNKIEVIDFWMEKLSDLIKEVLDYV